MEHFFAQSVPYVAKWVPLIAGYIFVIFASYCYAYRRERMPLLLSIAALYRVVLLALFIGGQYLVWQSSQFTQMFLNSPVDRAALESILGRFFPFFNHKLGYFLLYSWGRFVMNFLLVFIMVGLWYGILVLLRRYQPRFFVDGEVALGILAILIVGWPGAVIMIPATLLSMVMVAVVRLTILKKHYTTMGWPLLVAAAITLAIIPTVLAHTSFSVLKI